VAPWKLAGIIARSSTHRWAALQQPVIEIDQDPGLFP
jgi:hypothetical protein